MQIQIVSQNASPSLYPGFFIISAASEMFIKKMAKCPFPAMHNLLYRDNMSSNNSSAASQKYD